MTTLPPFQHDLGVFPNHVSREPTVLKLREKVISLSGDSFTVERINPQNGATEPFLACEGKVATMHARKIITDPRAGGQELFNIKKLLFRIHSQWEIVAPGTDTRLALIQSHFTLFSGAKLTLTFANAAGRGEPVEVKVEGDFFDRNAKITCDGAPVASIDRKFLNARQLVFDQQTYFLSVAPNVDAALMAAVCVCLDEKANEK